MTELNCIGCGKPGCDGKAGCDYYDSTYPVSMPPTEDRDWKERFRRGFLTKSGALKKAQYVETPGKIIDFISQEITAAEARGREEAMKDAIDIMKNVLGDFKNR